MTFSSVLTQPSQFRAPGASILDKGGPSPPPQIYVTTGELTVTNKTNVNYEVLDGATNSFLGANLVLTEKVEMQFIMTIPDLTNVTLEVTVGEDTYSLPASQFEVFSTSPKYPDSYKVNFSQMLATDMRADVTAKICCDGVVTSNTLLYSVESYAATKLTAANTAENLANLLKMMMYYGDAAAAYFNK